MEPRAFGQPTLDKDGLVSAIVVEDKMHVQACRLGYVHGVEKPTEFHPAVAPLALADHLPRLSFEGSKQGCRAVADIVVTAPFHSAGAHR